MPESLNLDPARHEEAAIYEGNQRIPNVTGLRSNPVISFAAQKVRTEAAVLARDGYCASNRKGVYVCQKKNSTELSL